MEIYVMHNGERLGPFSPQDAQAKIERLITLGLLASMIGNLWAMSYRAQLCRLKARRLLQRFLSTGGTQKRAHSATSRFEPQQSSAGSVENGLNRAVNSSPLCRKS